MLHIKGGTLLLREDGRYIARQGDLFVEKGVIVGHLPSRGEASGDRALRQAQGPAEEARAAQGSAGEAHAARGADAEPVEARAETIDATGKLVMPGLINMHTHAYMTSMRNLADDVDFDEWLFRRVMPVEEAMSPEKAYYSALLGCMEMLLSGTTCFVDMHMYEGSSCRAATEAGMRAFIGRGLVGEDLTTDGKSRFDEALREMEKYGSDTIDFVLSPHAIYSAGEKLLKQINDEASSRGMLKQIHLSESVNEIENCVKDRGVSPVKYLADIGFLDDKTIAAHCVQMTDGDIDLLKKCGVNVVTNPASNAKLGNGLAPINEMRDKGINVCLGTDGTASNNTLNMFREMTLFSMAHKIAARSSTAMDASYVLDCATVHAAKALGREGILGEIKEGAAADLVFLDLDAVSLFPPNDIPTSLVYSANGSEVTDVMVAGKFALRNREFTGIDADRVRFELKR